jgi:Fe2+ transport system protein FeoA
MATLTRSVPEQSLIPLSELRKSEEAVVHVADLEYEERISLAAMGLREDATFRLCQTGTPCIVQVEATRLGLSSEVTERILVRRCDQCNDS